MSAISYSESVASAAELFFSFKLAGTEGETNSASRTSMWRPDRPRSQRSPAGRLRTVRGPISALIAICRGGVPPLLPPAPLNRAVCRARAPSTRARIAAGGLPDRPPKMTIARHLMDRFLASPKRSEDIATPDPAQLNRCFTE